MGAKTLLINGNIYQPELAIWISEPSTVRLRWVSLPKNPVFLEKKSRTARWNVASCFQLRPSAMLELGDSNNQLAKPTWRISRIIWCSRLARLQGVPRNVGPPKKLQVCVWMLYTYTHCFYITLVWYTTVEHSRTWPNLDNYLFGMCFLITENSADVFLTTHLFEARKPEWPASQYNPPLLGREPRNVFKNTLFRVFRGLYYQVMWGL